MFEEQVRGLPRTVPNMADYPGDWLSFESALDAAFLRSLPNLHEHVIDPNAPSGVRVFGKSMHVLAAGWLLSVGWLWIATVQQHIDRQGSAPDRYAIETLIGGVFPAAMIWLVGIVIERWAGRAPNKWLQRREWIHAFWWSAVPNALLLFTVWVMLQDR
jgi:hypothetical protein